MKRRAYKRRGRSAHGAPMNWNIYINRRIKGTHDYTSTKHVVAVPGSSRGMGIAVAYQAARHFGVAERHVLALPQPISESHVPAQVTLKGW